ncbi:P-loop containing nucleoside triphosphate hydrolase protein [Microdochium trichocladiopsis]|uniref:P-loop containing nucleoside triphosphate hydrolase protein n=1 Tax=Microdochium trichocladiopsis TaxID=1682393 RepID=A0A9P8YDS0_9PEZI|nr:P-loop containing nucleoside triphosphate hydrolase protein [Microdochium trichocladiopsis]KAH7036040.1 P-loop containing nucleoside triphosphate hydrolase protein [Microdochium trichocladiopsis]
MIWFRTQLSRPTTKERTWSAEQLAIVERAKTHNVVVSARPGSGKTATAEAIAASNPDKSIAVLTYSRRLKNDTAKRMKEKYPGCDVFTFHGVAGKLHEPLVVRDDSILNQLRRSRARPTWRKTPYDIIIIDEMQDCTELLHWLVQTFISCVKGRRGHAPRIVVLGDERKAIYEFRGADARFLSDCPTIMEDLSPDPWARMTLSKSFRLSRQNADFINKAFLQGEDYIVGSHEGPRHLYIHADISDAKGLAKELAPLIRQYGAKNTAILGPAVRTNPRISRLTNHLTGREKIPVAEPISGDTGLDDLVIRGKLCVSTIHQFKGSERDLVILYGLDDHYFQIAPDEPDTTCPNDILVALSRASKQLVIVHDTSQQMMPFVDVAQLHATATHRFITEEKPGSFHQRSPRGTTQQGLKLPVTVAASDIARYVPDETLDAIVARHANVTVLSAEVSPVDRIEAPDKVPTDDRKYRYESVSDINGLAVVAAYELASRGTLTTLGNEDNASLPRELPSEPQKRTAWLCREACGRLAELSTFYSRLMQMHAHKWDWLEPYLPVACARLQEQFKAIDPADLKFEQDLKAGYMEIREKDQGRTGDRESTIILGRADIVQNTPSRSPVDDSGQKVTLWEIKFVSRLSREHVIQACFNAHLWAARNEGDIPRVMLYNIRNGEKWEISPKDGVGSLHLLVDEVLRAKYTSRPLLSDEEFLDRCAKVRKEVEGLLKDVDR